MRIHVVQKGDTLWKIAKKYKVDHDKLKKMNTQLTSPEALKPGMKVKVPTEGVPVKKAKSKEIPSYKKGTEKKKPMKKTEPYQPTSAEPATTVAASQGESERPPASEESGAWSFDELSGQKGNEVPEMAGPDYRNSGPMHAWPNENAEHLAPLGPNPNVSSSHYESNPMHPEHIAPTNYAPNEMQPEYVSPANYGPNEMHPEYVSPVSYGPNEVYPENVSPANYGPNMMHPEYVSPANYGPNEMYPENVSPANYGPNMMHPEYVSPANFGPNEMYPENVSPANYDPNMMHPHHMAPANWGPNQMYPENVFPANFGPNKMYPENVSPAHYDPNMMHPHHMAPANYPANMMKPMGSDCGCGGEMPGMWGDPFGMPHMGMQQMQGTFHPWEPSNDGMPYGMRPAENPNREES